MMTEKTDGPKAFPFIAPIGDQVTQARGSSDPLDQKQKSLLGETLRDPDRSLLRKWLTGHGLETRYRLVEGEKMVESEKMEQNRVGGVRAKGSSARLGKRPGGERYIRSDELVATDIFVEKAQVFLTTRGRTLYICGIFTSVLAIGLPLGAAWFVYGTETKQLLDVTNSSDDVSHAS
jgi:hypothetical protein